MAPGTGRDAVGGTAAARDAAGQGELSRADQEALAGLEFHWGDAYMTGRDETGTWWAARRDRIGAVLTAPSAAELQAAIRADYAASPVPRESRAGNAR